MSRPPAPRGWGPSHQHRNPPKSHRLILKLGAITIVLVAFQLFAHRVLHQGANGAASSTLSTVGRGGLILGALWLLLRAVKSGRLHIPLPKHRSPARRLADRLAGAEHPGEAVREHVRRLGGGAFLGFAPGGNWVTADPEHAVMVLGPPRSGKTSAIVIPALLGAPGAAVSTATKRDVLDATWHSRSEVGQVWLFDPTGEEGQLPREIRRLSWSPVSAASTWDAALLTARAMAACTSPGAGTTNEQHWRERSTALLAPLLFAATLAHRPIADVLHWVLRQDLGPPGLTLEDHDAPIANDVLVGIAKTDGRERSSIFSATAGVLAAYNADATRRSAAATNFDPTRFVASRDTLYVTAPGAQAGAQRAARRRPARADPPRRVRARRRVGCPRSRLSLPRRGRQHRPDPRPACARLRSRWPGAARDGLPAGPQPGAGALGRGGSRWLPVAVPGRADPQRHRRQPDARSDLAGAR
jgi:hypothetical protein